jgi:hypothetical protein
VLRRSVLVSLLLAGLVVSACSDDDGGGSTPAADWSVAGSLRQIPTAAVADEGTALVMTGDVDRATELAGLDRPSDPDSPATVKWIHGISGLPVDGTSSDVAIMPLDQLRLAEGNHLDEIREELGWSVLDVHTYAGVDSPPEHFIAMTGTFDADTINAAQGDRDDDIWSLGGDDFSIDVKDLTRARRLGQSVRTALHDDRLAESVSTPTMKAWLSGKHTLADDRSLVAVAEALDDHDVYSAALVLQRAGSDGSTPSSAGADDLAPFDGFGVGAAHDGDGAQAIYAYHCDDADAAEHNAEVLRSMFEEGESAATQQPWSEIVEVADIDVDGPVVVVTLDLLDGRAPTFALQTIFTREPFTVSP